MKFGPTFGEEIIKAGLGGLPIAWNEGEIFGRDKLTPEQNVILDAVIAAHDPNAVPEIIKRRDEFEAQPDRNDLWDKLQKATPGQIDNWLAAHMTNLAEARQVMAALLKVLATKLD